MIISLFGRYSTSLNVNLSMKSLNVTGVDHLQLLCYNRFKVLLVLKGYKLNALA